MHCLPHLRAALLGSVLATVSLLQAMAAKPVAVIWRGGETPDTPTLSNLNELIDRVGYEVQALRSDGERSNRWLSPSELDATRHDLLVLPDARHLPAESVGPIQRFLQGGGDVLAFNLPAWEDPFFRIGDQWLTRADYQAALARQRPEVSLLDLAHADASTWLRHSDQREHPTRWDIEPGPDGLALHVRVAGLVSWDILEPRGVVTPFPGRRTLTCFRAKGGPDTRQLALEWIEQDGSRWIASIDLTTDWQWYALPPEAFKAWEPKGGRGGAGDHFRPGNAARFTVGVALSHNTLAQGDHEFWLADLGAGTNPFGEDAPPSSFTPPVIESFSPGWHTYPVHGKVLLSAIDPRLVASIDSPGLSVDAAEIGLRAFHPRPQTAGWAQDRPWRWQPVITAYDAAAFHSVGPEHGGVVRGVVAVTMVHSHSPYRGGVWNLFTPALECLVSNAEGRRWLEARLKATHRGVFLLEGGLDRYSVREGQPVHAGARVVNFGRNVATNLNLLMSEEKFDLDPGTERSFEWKSWYPRPGTPRLDEVPLWTPLRQSQEIIDTLQHPLTVWTPKADPSFVTIRDGHFELDGKRWKPHGVNYMPSSGVGLANQDWFEHWLGRGAYDPEVIQRDLERIRDMGFNAVSAFIYHQSLEAGHLTDFLVRCERLGLKVNLSLRPGTPMDFRWAEMKELIEHFRLAENDTVFAYDLAWEPSHYDENYQRRHYNRLWRDWVTEHHGGIESAAKAWEHAAPTESDQLVTPPMAWLINDGPWRRIVADYRQFLDELVGERYAEARRLIRSIDPNHLVSFRMQLAGDPTHLQPGLLPYDFYGLRDAVDIWEPEAYGRIGNWERVRPGHFTAAYARLCDPAKPVVWAEMGYSVWDPRVGGPSEDKLEFAAQYYTDFYRMLRESDADGVFFWWYPGGYRVNERSDYGVIHPDGTDRSVTEVIRREGPAFMSAAKQPNPGRSVRVIKIDRDADARGLPGVYETVEDAYWKAVESGVPVELQWRRLPGE